MKLKKVRMMGYDLTVKFERVPGECHSTVTGQSWTWRNSIWVDARAAQRGEVVFHEALHHLENRLALHLTEDQVRVLSNGICGVLRDNPKLVKLIQSDK